MAKEDHRQTDISIIVTFHHEGAIAYKTLQNISQLVAPLQQQKISYEILLHIDNGNPETTGYLDRYAQNPNVKIYKNSFGNPSDSRNFCVQHARGRYVAIIDGDDIISDNWVIDGYHILETSESPLVLHTEADITFGNDDPEGPRVWVMSDARSDRKDIAYIFTRNRWSAGIILPRDVALKFPYRRAQNGFGYEDWTFNMDTRYAGILHKVVPKSVKFYRVRKGSTYSLHTSENTITDYTDMFSTAVMQDLVKDFNSGGIPIKSPNTNPKRLTHLTKTILSLGGKTISAVPGFGRLVRRGLNVKNRRHGRNVFRNLPQYIQDAWIAANQIDGEAWPDPLKLARLWYYDSDFNDLTELYCRLVSQIRKDPDYLFLPPQLSVGGTEKVLMNYVNAFAELHPDWHIVVLAALPKKHPYKVPDNVDFVDFYGLTRGRSWFEVDFILSRFVIQTKVKRLHIIHNEIGFHWAKTHLSLLQNNDYKLYISQFMDEYNKDPRLTVGFVDPWIRDLSPAITKVLTDNEPFAQAIINRIGLSSEQVVAHFQPIDAQLIEKAPDKPATPGNHKFRILWASRISPQKRPDLLKKVARELDPAQYSIDVYGRFQPPYNKRHFGNIARIATYRGTYQGIESLDLSQYDAFLYTSQTDGLPNVLLEIASAGLPIVASNVGGVSDIVNTKTGYPVAMDDIDGYVKSLQAILDNPTLAKRKAAKARKIIETRHTWQHFLDQVKRDII